MVNIDYYTSMAFALELLSKSSYHHAQNLGSYLHTEIAPTIWLNQIHFYVTEHEIPTAFVTWAWLSKSIEQEIHDSGRAIAQHEWNSGSELFINDLVAPYENARAVINDIKGNLFANYTATSLRRNPDGTVRKINRWKGVHANLYCQDTLT